MLMKLTPSWVAKLKKNFQQTFLSHINNLRSTSLIKKILFNTNVRVARFHVLNKFENPKIDQLLLKHSQKMTSKMRTNKANKNDTKNMKSFGPVG